MRKLNKNDYLALESILLIKDMSKAELSKILNISPPGIYKLINKLNERNLLSDESELLASKGGRPRTTISINREYKKLVGIFLNNNYIKTSIAHLDGEIIETRLRKRNTQLIQTRLIKMLVDEIEYVIEKYGTENIAGVGVAIPGLIDDSKGVIKSSPLFTGKNMLISEYIEDTFNIPCVIDNDVRSILKAEKLLGCLKEKENAFLVYVNNDLGSSLLINNVIYSGVNFAAGQIKNILIDGNISLGEYCDYKNILNRVFDSLKDDNDEIDMEYIIQKSNENISPFREIMEDIGKKIGVAISNTCQIIDIGDIILTGSMINNNKYLIEIIKNTIDESNSLLDNKIGISISCLEQKVEELASISLVMSNLFSGKKLIK